MVSAERKFVNRMLATADSWRHIVYSGGGEWWEFLWNSTDEPDFLVVARRDDDGLYSIVEVK